MKVEQIYTGCLAQDAYYIESNGEVKPYLMGSVTNLPPESFLYNAKKHQIIVDIREKNRAENFINGTFRFECDKALQNCIDLSTSLPLFIFCNNGKKSGYLAKKLAIRGHTVYKLRGGYQAWKRYLMKK